MNDLPKIAKKSLLGFVEAMLMSVPIPTSLAVSGLICQRTDGVRGLPFLGLFELELRPNLPTLHARILNQSAPFELMRLILDVPHVFELTCHLILVFCL